MGDGVRLNLNAEVAAILRTNLVAHIARDLAAAAGAPEQVMDQIMKGYQQQLLQRVTLVLQKDGQKDLSEAEMYIIMEVDWELHELFLSQGTSRSVFKIDLTRPPAEQVAPMLEKLRAFLAEKTRQYGSISVEGIFVSRPGKRQEMNSLLGTSPMSTERGRQLARLKSDQSMVIADKELPELTVEVHYRGEQKS